MLPTPTTPTYTIFMTATHSGWFIGLMSGTSLDGVDGVLAQFTGAQFSDAPTLQVQTHASCPMPPALRQELLALNSRHGQDELHRAALAGTAISRLYAQVVQALLQQSSLPASAVSAIGAHGQTVRHQPGLHDGVGYSLQLLNPAYLAERTGITVVADLRSRDVAAGGQGAPLVPAFHQQVFSQAERTALVLNIGGISNLSVLPPQSNASQPVLGFDCGPGNALMDAWCQQHTGQTYDADGAWAASGQVLPALLERLLQEPFFQQAPPKSTGRDLFHPAWLTEQLQPFAQAAPVDVQATLTAFTAQVCAQDALRYGRDAKTLLVCGGGALNTCLMQQLQQRLPGWQVMSTACAGLPPLQVEAAAFAWLARQCLLGLPGNLPAVTGAAGSRVLGAIYSFGDFLKAATPAKI